MKLTVRGKTRKIKHSVLKTLQLQCLRSYLKSTFRLKEVIAFLASVFLSLKTAPLVTVVSKVLCMHKSCFKNTILHLL